MPSLKRSRQVGIQYLLHVTSIITKKSDTCGFFNDTALLLFIRIYLLLNDDIDYNVTDHFAVYIFLRYILGIFYFYV